MAKRKAEVVHPSVAIEQTAEELTRLAYRWYFSVAFYAQFMWDCSEDCGRHRGWWVVQPNYEEHARWAADVGWLELGHKKRFGGSARVLCCRQGPTEPASIMLRLAEAPRGLGWGESWTAWYSLLTGIGTPTAYSIYAARSSRKGKR